MVSKSQPVYVRLKPEEREVLEKLTKYLYLLGKIPSQTMSDTLRYCLYFTLKEIVKSVEAERYGS